MAILLSLSILSVSSLPGCVVLLPDLLRIESVLECTRAAESKLWLLMNHGWLAAWPQSLSSSIESADLCWRTFS